MLKRFIASFAAISILMFVMPLGIFIKKSQENTACGGYRAIHQCSVVFESKNNPDSRVKFENVQPSPVKSSPSGQGPAWLLNLASLKIVTSETVFSSDNPIQALSDFTPRIDPPPRSLSFIR